MIHLVLIYTICGINYQTDTIIFIDFKCQLNDIVSHNENISCSSVFKIKDCIENIINIK